MNLRGTSAVFLLSLVFSVVASADKRELAEVRHPNLMEQRRYREKAAEALEKQGFRPMPRIIGGRTAADGEYPWMVALVEAGEADHYDGLFCGASLIHPRWVLTAAHCVQGQRAEDIEVVVGAADLSRADDGRRIAVDEIIIAPGYNPTTSDSDFALLRLVEPADGPVMPLLDDVALADPGVVATVIGWGDTTNAGGNFPTRLQEVDLPIVDLAVANESDAYQGGLTENMLAAGFASGGKDSCSGDSGGPLMVPSPLSPGWMQAGVVSFGAGCGLPDVYGIYTKIGNFRDFVIGHTLPNYAVWEQANGRRGELRDPDGNGFSNFEDFALPDHHLDQAVESGKVRLSYRRPFDATEVDYIIENAETLEGPWVVVAPDLVSVEHQDAGMSLWTFELPESGSSGVFRVRASVASIPAVGVRPLSFPGAASGQLSISDEAHPTLLGNRTKEYRLVSPPEGMPLAFSLRSDEFDARLELLDFQTKEILAISDSNEGRGLSGGDELLYFTPQAGVSYRLRVTSANPAGTGGFELSAWDPAALAVVPRLGVPMKVKGSLTSADDFDPSFLPAEFYHRDDYVLEASSLAEGRMMEFRMRSEGRAATSIDDFLALIDGESGRVVAANDDFAGRSNNAGLRFMPIPGKSYLLRASSAVERDLGRYILSAESLSPTKSSALATISLGGTAKGKIGISSEIDDRYYTFKRDYLLAPVEEGTKVFATMESSRFDAYLIVIDASDLSVVTEGDSGGLSGGVDNARVSFAPRAGHRYLIRCTSYDPRQWGAYTLVTGVEP